MSEFEHISTVVENLGKKKKRKKSTRNFKANLQLIFYKILYHFLHFLFRIKFIHHLLSGKFFRKFYVILERKVLSKNLSGEFEENKSENFTENLENEIKNIGKKPITYGLYATVVLFGSFLIWGLTAKIHSTAIAPGRIVLDSNNKKIQHLEGGIIEEIFIEEGQKVEKNQPLIKLSQTAANANQELLRKQLVALKASKIRLESERDSGMPNFSGIFDEFKNNPEFTKILEGEKNLFNTRKKSIDEKVSILTQKINQLNNEILALESQEKSVSKRISFLNDELVSLQKLYREGIIPKSRYLEMQRQMAELSGNKGEYKANISKVRQVISETELEIANTKTQNLNDIIKELQEAQTKIADLEERISASSDVLKRTLIVAPGSGIVNGLKFHTKGGVIAPGAELMEIIPQDDELIVEVKVNPQDIDVVTVGLDAKVHLSAYKAKTVPLLKGVVINVSADSFQEQNTGVSYFLARIRIKDGELKNLKNVKLYPGMPVEAYIVTGSRTFLVYLFDPITVSMRKAFREE